MNKNYYKPPYSSLPSCTPPPSTRSGGVVYPSYGQSDVYMLKYNELQKYTQHMNIQAQNYEYMLDSGMGEY